MITGYDVLEMLEQRNNGDIDGILDDGQEVLRRLYEEAKTLGMELERELESKALSENKCYLCKSELEVGRDLQYSEYQGKEVVEEIHITSCSKCDYVVGE